MLKSKKIKPVSIPGIYLFCKFLFLSICLFLFLSFPSCDNPTSPPNGADTTSHAFTWQTTELGGASGSYLSDVAIINDTLAYAVGQMYLNDSSGQVDPQPYNLAVWNGMNWNLERLYANSGFPVAIKCVFAINSTDVWLSPWFHWNGQGFQSLPSDPIFFGIGINKMWGRPGELYAVGTGGFVARYDGNTWTKIESGTSLDIQDIWGAIDPKTGVEEILAVASDRSVTRLLRIQGTTVSVVADSGLPGVSNGIWFVPGRKYYVVGAGINEKNSLSDAIWTGYPPGVVTSYESAGVRGNGINDVFVAGSFLEIVHYNGSTWYDYRKEIPYANAAVGRIAVRGNLVITVGLMGQSAIAIVGKR